MKFLFIALLLPVFGFSQAPKKAEKIIIETNLSQDQNYQLIGQVLLANDIELAETIKDFGIIKTEIMEKMTQLIFYKYYFQLIASEGKITINGKLRVNVDQTSNQNFNDIKNVGFKGAPSRKAFEEMERIAALFEGKKTYQ